MFLKFVRTDGRLDGLVVGEGWLQPTEVKLQEGRMKYIYREPLQRVKMRSGFFERFLGLASATDHQIVEYARVCGPLLATAAQPLSNEPRIADVQDGFAQVLQGLDSLDGWRQTAREMSELLELAAQIEHQHSGAGKPSSSKRSIERNKRTEIASRLNEWLFISAHPQVIWAETGWAVRMRIDNLLGALAMQLMLMISRKSGLAICGNCGGMFETDGKRKVYCAGCGLPAAQRAASKKLYDAKQLARKMHERGQSFNKIAAALGRRVEQVKRWAESTGRKG